MNSQLEPSDDELAEIEASLGDFLQEVVDKQTRAIPQKAKKRDAPAGIQRLDSLYKDPANWEPWANVTLIHQADVSTILGFCVEYRHKTVRGARKLVAGHMDSLGSTTEYVTDPWYLDWAKRKPHSAESSQLAFEIVLQVVLDDGLRTDGPVCVCVAATHGVGINAATLKDRTRLSSWDGKTILYLPEGIDLMGGVNRETALKLKEAFDSRNAENR